MSSPLRNDYFWLSIIHQLFTRKDVMTSRIPTILFFHKTQWYDPNRLMSHTFHHHLWMGHWQIRCISRSQNQKTGVRWANNLRRFFRNQTYISLFLAKSWAISELFVEQYLKIHDGCIKELWVHVSEHRFLRNRDLENLVWSFQGNNNNVSKIPKRCCSRADIRPRRSRIFHFTSIWKTSFC